MAALESLNFDVDGAVHYIHCVLSNVPLQLSVSELGPKVVPDPNSAIVMQMDSIGFRVIPHRLHIYKEPLSTKFGFVTFFIAQAPSPASSVERDTEMIATPAKVHELATTWVRQDLTKQLASIGVKVQLGQPLKCYSSVPFLRALNEKCSFLDAEIVKDTKKLETFLLTKMAFDDESINNKKNKKKHVEKSPSKDNNTEESWNTVGSLHVSSLNSRELLWLSQQNRRFPPILVTNDDFAHATCDQSALRSFLENTLNPIVEVLP
ncbi:uncharacterized protein TM35_000172500 [Trypanosoma theileri]|uniref:Uncharacterized protein n=1 Tax=Trypanosoma theileri TaxID=67003 RepID=A0A1X0NV05_9TRYP|nr:uncharacterized protein TM35_000172500 [Trypanosoma theileri]ORC88378.1 hypothetical protein TM35_000172500 [Trypanosoma theileri]